MTTKMNTLFSSPIQAALARLWEMLSSDGLPPYKSIEQVSYLLVLKQTELAGERGGFTSACPLHWSTLRAVPEAQLLTTVAQAMAWLRDESGLSLFHAAHLSLSKAALLREVLTLIDILFPSTSSGEQHAQRYDALLSLAEEAARAYAAPGGAFYTPHHIASLLCAMVRPQPGERIGDIACGNGRLLAAAYAQVMRMQIKDLDTVHFAPDGQPLPLDGDQQTDEQQALLAQTQFVGMDIDESAALHAWVLLRFLGIASPSIYAVDALSEQAERRLTQGSGQEARFDVLLANPPYSAHIDREMLDAHLHSLNTPKAELLFLGRVLHWLRPGGRAALIVPDSVLFNQQKAAVSLRRTLVTEHRLHAIISLPARVFAPYTNVKTSILVLTHSGVTGAIWCYEVEHDGYSLDKRRQPTPERNDLPDLTIKYGLHVANTLAALRPSAFIDEDTELQWDNIEPEQRAWYYAQPLVTQAIPALGTLTGTTRSGLQTLAVPVKHPKHWEIQQGELDEQCILLPGRYRPLPGHMAGNLSARSASIRRREQHTSSANEGRPAPIRISYVPGVKDLTTLAWWYKECLKALRDLHRRGHFHATHHLASLRLLADIRALQEKEFSRHPPLEGGTLLTPVAIARAGDVSSWFQDAIRELQKRADHGELSPDEVQRARELLAASKRWLFDFCRE